MNDIVKPYHDVQTRLQQACVQAGRQVETVHCLAVSKGQTVDAIRALADCGQVDFGENIVQEALPKIQALQARNLTWHFIGQIQGNKTKAIAQHFTWVHSVSRVSIVERLQKYRDPVLPSLQVCCQVNLDDEPQKAGVSMAELPTLCDAIQQCSRLHLRGLMAVPQPRVGLAAQRESFARLAVCLQEMQSRGFAMDTLSMGMSDDLEAAVMEGATWVRLGRAFFGERTV